MRSAAFDLRVDVANQTCPDADRAVDLVRFVGNFHFQRGRKLLAAVDVRSGDFGIEIARSSRRILAVDFLGYRCEGERLWRRNWGFSRGNIRRSQT